MRKVDYNVYYRPRYRPHMLVNENIENGTSRRNKRVIGIRNSVLFKIMIYIF